MQLSADGFVAGPNGELDWMTWQWDEKLADFAQQLTNSFDTILMGRKMCGGFTAHWEKVTENPEAPEYAAARVFVDTPKIVYSRTAKELPGKNVSVENGDLAQTVKALKKQPGKDIMVYGGAEFVASLIEHGLIDELNLFINPTAIGAGLRIFNQRTNLKLVRSKAYKCGIVVLTYKPVR